MSYTLECEAGEDFLKVVVRGEWPVNNPKLVLSDVYSRWRKAGLHSLLVDVRGLSSSNTVLDDYQVVMAAYEIGLHQVRRIAILDKETRRRDNEFMETVALNEGIRTKFFHNEQEDEAIAWIEGVQLTPLPVKDR